MKESGEADVFSILLLQPFYSKYVGPAKYGDQRSPQLLSWKSCCGGSEFLCAGNTNMTHDFLFYFVAIPDRFDNLYRFSWTIWCGFCSNKHDDMLRQHHFLSQWKVFTRHYTASFQPIFVLFPRKNAFIVSIYLCEVSKSGGWKEKTLSDLFVNMPCFSVYPPKKNYFGLSMQLGVLFLKMAKIDAYVAITFAFKLADPWTDFM